MSSSTRAFLLIFLAALQFIAPLAHAHAGHAGPELGLHVPGLERYGIADDSLTLQASSRYASSEGFIFSVDAGIQQSRHNTHADAGSSYYLPPQIPLFQLAVPPAPSPFPRQETQFTSRPLMLALSPRAPPAR